MKKLVATVPVVLSSCTLLACGGASRAQGEVDASEVVSPASDADCGAEDAVGDDVALCVADCSGRQCGEDPLCGSSCGSCPASERCALGSCFPYIEPGPEVDWISLEGGRFIMGDPDGEYPEQYNHAVRVESFQIARTEVTIEQYRACLQATDGCTSAPDTGDLCLWGWKNVDDHPVNCVDWFQASEFCAWAGGRLPSESEWEYAACSGALGLRYPWGDEGEGCDYTVIKLPDDSLPDEEAWGCGEGHPLPVCSRPLGNTPSGLCDMGGNVGEWVEDDYHETYDPSLCPGCPEGHPRDGSAWIDEPRGEFRMVRGWNLQGPQDLQRPNSSSLPKHC